ncbi:MAG TPA: hypothetical protein VLS25_09155 [Dehalococcoidia bacterium]|nr:hypothetical protein [Dehalococcoidia bacterium]
MTGSMDEYLVHQAVRPIAEVDSDHRDWQDRFYFNFVDSAGEFVALTGYGAFPNRNAVQALMLVNLSGEHFAYFGGRPLEDDREVMQAGTLSYEIIVPLKSWRLELADEANSIRGSLEFHARCPLYTFRPIQWKRGDYTVAHQMHYTQSGRYKGSFTVGDRTFTDLVGIRDRSWGIRDMGQLPMWIWISAQFPKHCVSAWLWETPEGEIIHEDGAITYEDGRVRPITRIEHELEVTPGHRHPRHARFRLTTDDGEVHGLTAAEISSTFLAVPQTRWSESDAQAMATYDARSYGHDQHVQYEMGGETGYGIVEYMFTGGVKKYGIPPSDVPR